MTKIIVDRELLDKLHHLRERLELCDEQGRRLAVVEPTPVDIPVSAEDRQRIEEELKAGKFYTTAEVLAHLKSLERP